MTPSLSNLPPSCPIYGDIAADVAALTGLSRDMLRQLRKLRRDLKACEECPNYDPGLSGNRQCPFLSEFQAQTNAAINEVWEEWNQSAYSQQPSA
jgi:hypothetical protein